MSFRKIRAVRRWPSLAAMIGIALLFWLNLYAQKNKSDTLSVIRDFVAVSSGYKEIPIYLNLEMKNSTNVITSEEDTAAVQAEFFLQKANSYVRFGDVEQVVSDSMALLVSDELQIMILYTDVSQMIKQIQDMMGTALPDSSVRMMAQEYASSVTQPNKETTRIELQSRAFLYGTSLTREEIILQYDTKSKLPKQIATTRRTLLPLDSLQYAAMEKQPGFAEKLLTLEGTYFLIKEQVSDFMYKKIEKGATAKTPVTIADRIMKTEDGEYKPVKKYENYTLTIND